MAKQIIKLNEEELQKIVEQCTCQILNEGMEEGRIGNFIRGMRQGRQDYKNTMNQYKDYTKQQKTASKTANKTAKQYGKYIPRDIQTIQDILTRYENYPQISKSAKVILGALTNLNIQLSNYAAAATQNYQNAKTMQQDKQNELDANMTQNVRNMFSGQQIQQPTQQYSQVG